MTPGEYIKEVKTELSHVSWPTKKQTMFFSILVVVLSIAVAVYLGVFDFIFRLGVEKLIIK